MKRNNIKKYVQRLSFPLVGLMLILGVFGIIISCETEDDIPPKSAYVAPEPIPPTEDCVFGVIVPEIAEGIDFECGAPETTFFGEKDGSLTIEGIDNPHKEGINTSNKVMQVVQTAGIEPWAGFFFDLATKIDFSEKQTIKIKVFSPGVDQNINLKLEDSADGTISKEVTLTTTVADEWEELSFAFSPSDTDKFDRMVLFFDFSGPRDATTTHYFDDIVLSDGSATEEPVDDSEPTNTAPDPTVAMDKVISLFSDAYTNVPVDTWRTEWSDATLEDIVINDNNIKKYSELNFVGIETVANQIDASAMTHFHANVWTADATEIRIKLVDFGANGAFDGGGDDVEHEIVIPSPAQKEWVSLDIPLSEFTGLTTRANIAQLILVGSPSKQNTIYVDNVYFYDIAGVSTEPGSAAPTPTVVASDVISLFSDAYTNVPVDTWRTEWSQATLEDISIMGNAVKKYSGLNFVGVETVANQIDASEMEFFHTDIWTADATEIRIKLVDFGANGAFDGGGDDVEHEITIANPQRNSWISLDIPLSDFTGLTTRANIAQLIFAGQPAGAATVFVDNVYFYKNTPVATEPVSAAPTPTVAAADVISLFSDAYTDVAVDTWRTEWSQATLEDISIMGNAVKKYSGLNFVGIETVGNQIDATEMQFFHTNVWTADATEIRIKLVDFGANGVFDGGGDDVEHEITISNPQTNTWLSLDIPLSEFTGLTTRANISQLIYAVQPAGSATIFIDNVYFHN